MLITFDVTMRDPHSPAVTNDKVAYRVHFNKK